MTSPSQSGFKFAKTKAGNYKKFMNESKYFLSVYSYWEELTTSPPHGYFILHFFFVKRS